MEFISYVPNLASSIFMFRRRVGIGLFLSGNSHRYSALTQLPQTGLTRSHFVFR